MAIILGFFFIYLFTSTSTLETRTEEEYRLPDTLEPLFYQIHITLTADALTESSNEFTGEELIFVTVKKATDFIALHAHHDYIKLNKVTFNFADVASEDYSVDNVTDILRINTSSLLEVDGIYSVGIEYTGILSTSDMYGFYKSSYVDENGDTKYLATTFFSPVYARRAFPCFDEPAFKATFDFSFTIPTGLNIFFNTLSFSASSDNATGLTRYNFNTSPRMSTFVLAFIVSEFTCSFGNSAGNIPMEVCSRASTRHMRELALWYGEPLLETLNKYTNFSYGKSMQKMNQVAIPDFAANAMENWGLITYRETALLWDSNESSNSYKQQVITVMAHELAHQWFGNLVTQYWWSAIFLKEGFARYFQYHTPHEVFPDWELDKQFVIEQVHSALSYDALANTHALHADVYTPAEITARFSTISYNKGACILRMVEHFMSKELFKSGIQNYVELYESETVQPEDVWLALDGSVVDSISNLPANFTTVMENWIREPGYPLLYVSLSGNTITISQKRFLLTGEDTTIQWYVPISYTISSDSNKFETTSPILWLTPDGNETVNLPENYGWIILNNQQTGYYRVNYDPTLWSNIRAALLRDNFDDIIDLNRAHIVNDLFSLARASEIKYSNVLDILKFLANDDSYFSWYSAFSGFDFLLMRVGQDSHLGELISATVLELMSRLYNSVPISTLKEDDQIYTLKQSLANNWACRLGNENCIQQVQQLFSQYKTTGQRPNRNLRGVIYCNALRYTSDSSDWNFLWQAYINSSDLATEQITILSSLGCTKDEALLRQYLNKSITDGSGIRTQDALSVFSSVYTGSSVGLDIAFEFLIENFEIIASRYNSMNSLGNLIRGIAERFTTESQVSKLKDFVASGSLPEAFQVSANEAVEIAETNLKWLQNFEGDLFSFYDNGGCRMVNVPFWIIFMAVLLLVNS